MEQSDRNWTCADLCDAHGDNISYPDSFAFRHFSKKQKFFGKIRTVSCIDDNSEVKQILSEDGEGCVLVVDGNGSMRRALMGDMIAAEATKNKWSGVVINGAIRDSVEIGGMDSLGVVALGTNPRKSEKRDIGTKDSVVSFNGVTFRPNDWIYVDQDGFVVSRSKL